MLWGWGALAGQARTFAFYLSLALLHSHLIGPQNSSKKHPRDTTPGHGSIGDTRTRLSPYSCLITNISSSQKHKEMTRKFMVSKVHPWNSEGMVL